MGSSDAASLRSSAINNIPDFPKRGTCREQKEYNFCFPSVYVANERSSCTHSFWDTNTSFLRNETESIAHFFWVTHQ